MNDKKDELIEPEYTQTQTSEVDSTIRQEVEGIKEAVNEVVSETSLSEKVDELSTLIDNISEDVQSWRTSRKDSYVEALETLKSQVEEIQSEWENVSTSMKAQRERLESVLQSFPGVIETSTLRALSLRVTHLEQLLSELFQESHAKSTKIGARKQLTISLVALGITVVLWALWIVLAVTK